MRAAYEQELFDAGRQTARDYGDDCVVRAETEVDAARRSDRNPETLGGRLETSYSVLWVRDGPSALIWLSLLRFTIMLELGKGDKAASSVAIYDEMLNYTPSRQARRLTVGAPEESQRLPSAENGQLLMDWRAGSGAFEEAPAIP